MKINADDLTSIHNCSNCNCRFQVKLKYGYIGLHLIIPIIIMLIAFLLSGDNFYQIEISIFILSIAFIGYFIYQPYSIKLIK